MIPKDVLEALEYMESVCGLEDSSPDVSKMKESSINRLSDPDFGIVVTKENEELIMEFLDICKSIE